MSETINQRDDDNDNDSSDDDDPEYQLEQVQVLDDNDSCFYCFHIWTIIPPTLTFLSHLHSQQEEISGARVWTGSLLLAQYFCSRQLAAATTATATEHTNNNFLFGTNHLQPRYVDWKTRRVYLMYHSRIVFYDKLIICLLSRVLELGCGTGILGMTISKVLLRRCAQQANSGPGPARCAVVLTDGNERAMALLQKNIQNPDNEINTTLVGCHLLKWGSDYLKHHQNAFETWCRSRHRNRRCCWKHLWEEDESQKPIHFQFDCIVAGDVLYKKELPQLFFQTAHILLVKDTGVLWLCHVPRAAMTHEIVLAEANRAGFQVEQVSFKVRMERFPAEDIISHARIYRMTVRC